MENDTVCSDRPYRANEGDDHVNISTCGVPVRELSIRWKTGFASEGCALSAAIIALLLVMRKNISEAEPQGREQILPKQAMRSLVIQKDSPR